MAQIVYEETGRLKVATDIGTAIFAWGEGQQNVILYVKGLIPARHLKTSAEVESVSAGTKIIFLKPVAVWIPPLGDFDIPVMYGLNGPKYSELVTYLRKNGGDTVVARMASLLDAFPELIWTTPEEKLISDKPLEHRANS